MLTSVHNDADNANDYSRVIGIAQLKAFSYAKNDDYPALIDIGYCSFQFVQGTFRGGVQNTKWGIDGVLKAMHNLFDESAANREDYQNITGSEVFHCLSVDPDGFKT